MTQPIQPNIRKHFLQEMHNKGIPKGGEAKAKEAAVKAAFARCAPGGKIHESFGSITEEALKAKTGNAWDQAKEQFLGETSGVKVLKFVQIYKNYHAVPVAQREPFVKAMREQLAEAKFTKSEINNFLAMTGANLGTLMKKGAEAVKLVREVPSENAMKEIEKAREALGKQGFSDSAVATYLLFEECTPEESQRIGELYGSNPSIHNLLEFFGPAVFAEKLGKIEGQLSGKIEQMERTLKEHLGEIPGFNTRSPGEKYQALKLLQEKVAVRGQLQQLELRGVALRNIEHTSKLLLPDQKGEFPSDIQPSELKALHIELEAVQKEANECREAKDAIVGIRAELSAKTIENSLPREQLALLQNLSRLRYPDVSPAELKELQRSLENIAADVKAVDSMVSQRSLGVDAIKGQLELGHRTGATVAELKEKVPIQALKVACLALALSQPEQQVRQALLDSGLSEKKICEQINARPIMKGNPITVSIDAHYIVLENLNYERQLQDLGFTQNDLQSAFRSYSPTATMADEHVMGDAWKQLLTVDSSVQESVDALCPRKEEQKEFVQILWTNVANTNFGFRSEFRNRQPISLQLLQYALNRNSFDGGKDFLAYDLREMSTCRATIGEMEKLGLSKQEIFQALQNHLNTRGLQPKGEKASLESGFAGFERGYDVTTLRIALAEVKQQQEAILQEREKRALNGLHKLGGSDLQIFTRVSEAANLKGKGATTLAGLKTLMPRTEYIRALEGAQKKATREKIDTLLGELQSQYGKKDLIIHVLFQDGQAGRRKITGNTDVSLETLEKISIEDLKRMFVGREPELLDRLMQVKEIETQTVAKVAQLKQKGVSEEELKNRIINNLNGRSGSVELKALATHLGITGVLGLNFDQQMVKEKCTIDDLQQFFGSRWFLTELNKF